jgi:thiamine pyrophosphokinase
MISLRKSQAGITETKIRENKMTVYIFTGGDVFADSLAELGIEIPQGSAIIAADSGYATAKRLGVKPDLLLGDLDSLDKSFLDDESEPLEKIIVSPVKDDTDTQLAVDTAIDRYSADEIIIVGGLGGRLDHTLSNVYLLEYTRDKGVDCIICDGRNRVRLLCADGIKKSCRISKNSKYLSLISLTDKCEGVSISGVFYPLSEVELTRSYSYAISNEITSKSAEISIFRGKLLIIECCD